MISRSDLLLRIEHFERYLKMRPNVQGVHQARMREVIRTHIGQLKEADSGDVCADFGVLNRVVGIALGCRLISESQMMYLDSRYASGKNA